MPKRLKSESSIGVVSMTLCQLGSCNDDDDESGRTREDEGGEVRGSMYMRVTQDQNRLEDEEPKRLQCTDRSTRAHKKVNWTREETSPCVWWVTT